VVLGAAIIFRSNDGSKGHELWKSDGTGSGTVTVKNIRAGSGNSSPTGMTAYGSYVYFSANDGSSGFELWRSDGTTTGTTLFQDIRSGSANPNPHDFVVSNGTLYSAARGTSVGEELFKSDGREGQPGAMCAACRDLRQRETPGTRKYRRFIRRRSATTLST
jgi:ELWxxDGT repeat protein